MTADFWQRLHHVEVGLSRDEAIHWQEVDRVLCALGIQNVMVRHLANTGDLLISGDWAHPSFGRE